MSKPGLRLALFTCLGACSASLGAYGCKGSEHVVLAPIAETVRPPEGGAGAGGSGGGPPDSGRPPEPPPPDAAATDGSSTEDPELDPDIVFEWTETLPGQGGCGANTFVGSFNCAFEEPLLAPIVGQLFFELTDEREGQLTLDGRLTDITGTGVAFAAKLVGALDCPLDLQAVGEGGMLFAPFSMPGVTFTAMLRGTYDAQTLEIAGDIVITNNVNELVCTGPFSVGAIP